MTTESPTESPQVENDLLPGDAATVIHLVRENLRLLSALVARYEVGRTEHAEERRAVSRAVDVAEYFQAEMADLAQEQLRVLLLDNKNRILGSSFVYQGSLNTVVVRLAECFREAVRVSAASIILVHNHPTGDPTPSPEDIQLTQEAAEAGELLDIELLDHVIVGRPGYASLREQGFYQPPAHGASHAKRRNRRTVHRGERIPTGSIDG